MGLAPVGLVLVVGGKEAIVDAIANLAKRTSNCFLEATLIASFIDKLLSGNDDERGAAKS